MTRAAEPAAATNKVQLEIFPPLQEIHKRVMALSFRDCHTKIRHVDAHATLNEGVVVQVMGELSNNMQPMRKFMQTFVLAPEVCTCAVGCLEHCFCCSHADLLFFFLQGTVANKFYVHNDVFRYQDEVFGDSDSEPPEGGVTFVFSIHLVCLRAQGVTAAFICELELLSRFKELLVGALCKFSLRFLKHPDDTTKSHR